MRLSEYFSLVRPKQWLKNLMLFFAPFLGGHIFDDGLFWRAFLPLLAFCSAAGAMYVVNDIIDRGHDILHPTKKFRPIASGKISAQQASFIAIFCLVIASVSSMAVSWLFSCYVAAYLLISTAYSYKLKNIAILDLFCIASGFLLRLQAGGEAFNVPISEWLFSSVFLLAIFLSAGKRLGERSSLGKIARFHRHSLRHYPTGLLDGIMIVSGGAVLVTYTMYSLPRHPLVYSVPLCTYGLFRYVYRVKAGCGGDPTDALLKDRQLFVTGILWVGIVGWSIYW